VVSLIDDEEYKRWIEMSKRTLLSAEGDLGRGDYNWACFKAHQAAEYAVKALLHGLGLTPKGHSISLLLHNIPRELNPDEILDHAKTLDKYYIPTRYPNAWSEGIPTDYYTLNDSKQAVSYASMIIDWVEGKWKSLRKE
jgi:HEPN domain-containing protein